jgi:hypothetical protein
MAVIGRTSTLEGTGEFIARLRSHALRALGRMYRREERLFVFRHRGSSGGVVAEGLSPRYSAISVIGLAEDRSVHVPSVLDGHDLHHVCGRLLNDVARSTNLGTVALILWAARAADYPDRRWAWERLIELRPVERAHPTVEVAWSLAALCMDTEAEVGDLRERLARRLIASLDPRSAIFPHGIQDGGTRRRGVRSHVACFADLVYPVHALALYAQLTGDRPAREAAVLCADHFCGLQGADGQWWWHYDRRSGRVVERYPVYAVHQDAMAPMALLALEEATGHDYTPAIARGLAWLQRSPELGGGSLMDSSADVIWRKVARREPAKLSRYAQGLATRLHPRVRVPGLDLLFPPSAVDREDRPYHLGWLLHAWSPARLARCEPGCDRA